MSHPYIHAESSVKIHGGIVEDYIKIHSWFDESKSWTPDWRHRAMRHHVEGIKECMNIFGEFITNTDGEKVSVYEIGVQHQVEDVGFLPLARDWFEHFDEQSWKKFQNKKIQERTKLSKKIEDNYPLTVKETLNSL